MSFSRWFKILFGSRSIFSPLADFVGVGCEAGLVGDGTCGVDPGLAGRDHNKAKGFNWIAEVYEDVTGYFYYNNARTGDNENLMVHYQNRCRMEHGAETPTAQYSVLNSYKSALVGRCSAKNF